MARGHAEVLDLGQARRAGDLDLELVGHERRAALRGRLNHEEVRPGSGEVRALDRVATARLSGQVGDRSPDVAR